jgi:predicted CDP-diglyceride synthetase/phosphatidate cytidylyltransferase
MLVQHWQLNYGHHHELLDRYKISILQWQWIFPLFKNRSIVSSITDRTFTGLCVTRQMSYVLHELLILREYHDSSPFLFSWWRIFLVFSVVLFVLIVFVLCLVACISGLSSFCVLLPVSLDCPSVFSCTYLVYRYMRALLYRLEDCTYVFV